VTHEPPRPPDPPPFDADDLFDDELQDATDIPSVPATVGEIQELVDELIIAVQQARTVPLSGSVMVDRHDFEAKLQRLRAELPEELRAARWMVREREAFIAKTNERGKEIVDRAKAHAAHLVSETQVMTEAVAEANYLVRNAENDAMRIRLQAEDEIEEGLEQIDHLLAELLDRVRRRRAELHEARPASPEVPYAE
jgi:hypothetical protein